MNRTDDSTFDSSFTMPLTSKTHQIADRFRQQQSNPQRAKQVYLNTLAVQAVSSYLEWLGITTDPTAGDSWNPMMQTLADVADLVIPDQGKLECRPVLPQAQVCYVPAEVWSDRLGYVAVQFDPDLTEATLLGVLPQVDALEVPLTALRSLDELFDYLQPQSLTSESAQPESAAIATLADIEVDASGITNVDTEKIDRDDRPDSALDRIDRAVTHLSRWLTGTIETGWQSIESVFGEPQVAWSMRGAELEMPTDATPELPAMQRAKPLSLSAAATEQVPTEQVVLIVGMMPLADQETPNCHTVWVKLAPLPGVPYLPAALDLLILDEAGSVVMQAQSRETEMIQLRFIGYAGEQFAVQLVLGAERITESFVI